LKLQEFFARVLPGAGLRVICHSLNGRFGHVYKHTDLEAAQTALNYDNRGYEVYFACATFKTKSRKAEDAHSVKSFWLDIDAGPNKPYANWREAAKAVVAFVKLLKLPNPLLVSSGRGLHVYWTLEKEISPDEWVRVARKLKAVTEDVGLKADPSRTADISSILRPPYTYNRKETPRIVMIFYEGESCELDEFEAALDTYIEDNDILLSKPTAHFDLNDDLTGPRDRNCDADKIAEKCAVVRMVRDTRGNVDEPTWYHTLQILAYCKNGEQLAHEWSNGYPRYSATETTEKFQHAVSSGALPTRCDTFAKHHPELCKSCPYFDRDDMSSPIKLSYFEVVETPSGEKQELPANYVIRDDRIYRINRVPKGEETKDETVEVTSGVFYLVDRYDLDEEGMAYKVEYKRQGKIKNFTVTSALIAKGGSDLMSEFGKHEIYTRRPHELQNLLKTWIELQRERLKEKRLHQHFGWQDGSDGFLLGNKLYRPNSENEVLLKGSARKYGRHLHVSGSYDRWKEIIDRAYNHPGLEGLQFLVVCGFAAPIFALLDEFGGVTVYAYSDRTGKGKSTACYAALSAWGYYKGLMTALEHTTTNAFWEMCGAYHTLPILYDELTNLNPEQASQLVFGMTSGQPKNRLKSTGEPLDNNSSWRTILLATGNNQLSEKLVANRANPEAEIARIFEFPAWAQHEVEAKEAATLFRDLLFNYGHAGVDFVRYITDNREAVISRLIKWREGIIDAFNMSSQERYWSALFASVMCALEICRKRGILRFEMKPLLKWIGDQLESNRGNQKVMAADPQQHFSRMLADLASGIIESQRWGNLIKGEKALTTDRRPTGPIIGRLILNEKKLYISVDAVRKWCVKHKISATEMMKAVTDAGWVSPKTMRKALGQGTEEYASVMGALRVYVVDMEKVESSGLSGVHGHVVGGSD